MINIFPTRLRTIIKLYFYSFNFFKIIIANILMTIFLTIKKIEINKMNLKIIRPPIMNHLFLITKSFIIKKCLSKISIYSFYYNFHKMSTRKLRHKSTNDNTCNNSNKISN